MMIENQEDDEFIAVRVQDPRVQNEGSWNSHVDFKIFLHTNSKSFTAKTSCVRRRYSEFVWLKKKLQKNTGLVPVPDLPGKSFFSFSNEDFLERRRTGLQSFLDKVLHMTVCLSDSQLHLFMQTQLPVRHIEDCVQGHTPYTVTDAILTYASSNQGFAQAQEEDLLKERGSSVVSYESMESPAPHLPSQQTNSERDTLQAITEVPDVNTAELIVCHSEGSSLQVLQEDNRLEAVIEQHRPTAPTFYLGSGHDEPPAADRPPSVPEATQTYRIQAPVEVHSPTGAAVAPDCQEVEEALENGCVVAEECLVETESTEEEADPRAPSVPADGVCTDGQEEDDDDDMNGNDDSGDHTEAVCRATGVLDHVVSEQEEDDEEEKEDEVMNSEQQILKQTSSAEQELDLEHHLSSEKPGMEQVGVSEQPLERDGGSDGRIENGHPQVEERRGEEFRCTKGMVDPGMETSGIDPTINTEDNIGVEQEDVIQNVNGHLGKSTEEVAPSTGVEDTSVCNSHTNTYSTDNLVLSEEDDAQRETKGAPDLSQTTGDLGPDRVPELGASA